MWAKQKGFTIVELLIVVVVIAILATISIVAFNGIQQRARASEASSALTQAKRKLELYKVDNSTYPTSGNLTAADISNSGSITYQYTSSGTTFCLTATSVNVSYKVSDNTGPQSGGCAGHGQGGVAAITNIALDPRATGSNWLSPIVAGVTRTLNVSWNGKTNWSRFVWNGTGATTSRMFLNLSDLTDNETYTISFMVGNDGASPMNIALDFCDVSNTVFTVQAGEQKRVTISGSLADYTTTYRFIDLSLSTANATGVLVSDAMVTRGSTSYNYADGTSTDWTWNGTANNSTSTGPPL